MAFGAEGDEDGAGYSSTGVCVVATTTGVVESISTPPNELHRERRRPACGGVDCKTSKPEEEYEEAAAAAWLWCACVRGWEKLACACVGG